LRRPQRTTEAPTFLLDECLAYRIADILREVGFPITSARNEGVDGWEDPDLIPWLGERGYVWVTKDDSARNEHRILIQRAGISVVWVRGVERPNGTSQRNAVNLRQLLHMLVAKLDEISSMVQESNGPRFFLLSMATNGPRLKPFGSITDVWKDLAHPRRGGNR
jgi:predicted nuclease of predicted toxin-antitoxin system